MLPENVGDAETFTKVNSSSIMRLQANHSHDGEKITVMGQIGGAVRRSILRPDSRTPWACLWFRPIPKG